MALTPVGHFSSRIEAEMAQGLLRSQGLDCIVVTDDAGGAYPFQFGSGAVLMVDERDHAAAEALLADVR